MNGWGKRIALAVLTVFLLAVAVEQFLWFLYEFGFGQIGRILPRGPQSLPLTLTVLFAVGAATTTIAAGLLMRRLRSQPEESN